MSRRQNKQTQNASIRFEWSDEEQHMDRDAEGYDVVGFARADTGALDAAYAAVAAKAAKNRY